MNGEQFCLPVDVRDNLPKKRAEYSLITVLYSVSRSREDFLVKWISADANSFSVINIDLMHLLAAPMSTDFHTKTQTATIPPIPSGIWCAQNLGCTPLACHLSEGMLIFPRFPYF